MSELVIRPSGIDVREVIEGELVDDEYPFFDGFDEVGPCPARPGESCGDYRCCRP